MMTVDLHCQVEAMGCLVAQPCQRGPLAANGERRDRFMFDQQHLRDRMAREALARLPGVRDPETEVRIRVAEAWTPSRASSSTWHQGHSKPG